MPRLSSLHPDLTPTTPQVKSTPQRLAALGLSLALASLLTACSKSSADAGEAPIQDGIREREIPPVRPCTVKRCEMVSILDTTSRLESDREVQIFPELPGRAVEILVEEGDRVVRGDVLARLDHRDEQLALRDAEVALEEAHENQTLATLKVEEARDTLAKTETEAQQAERDTKRDEELFSSSDLARPLSQQQLEARRLQRDQAEHAVEQAKIGLRRSQLEQEQKATAISRLEVALERARLALTKKDIIAPFDGVISLRNIRVGDSVGTTQAAFVLTDPDHLRAGFSRPQEELSLFAGLRAPRSDAPTSGGTAAGPEGPRGLTIRATTEAFPDLEFTGYVERISPTIDPTSGQFRVVARIHEADPRRRVLLTGMLVRMQIVTDRHPDALVVPKRALRREGDRRFVLAIAPGPDGDCVRRIEISEGFQDEESVEILPRVPGSLDAGTRLVLIGSRDLRDGDPVRVDELGPEEGTIHSKFDEVGEADPSDASNE